MRRTFSLALAFLSAAPALGAQQPQSLDAIADRVFAPVASTNGPGCAVGIARGGKVQLTKGYGMADLNGGRAITGESVLESGSVAKQFTATSMLLLARDGKLSIDDDVRKYIPELPTYDKPITIRHLLTHTSGLREWSNLVEWQGWPRGTRVHTQGEFFELITHQKALNYPVGDFYSYTNSGFLLARTIIERVSGQTLSQFTAERIFKPLGMTRTQWRDDYTKLVPSLSQAYRRRPDGWHLDMPNDNVIGAGGLLTTVGDWLTWNEALTSKAMGATVVDSLTRHGKLTSGREIQYALGLVDGKYRGTREIGHSGSTGGYSTYLARYPELGNLSIAVMCNAAGAPATQYTHALVDAMAPTLATAMPPDTSGAPVRDLARLAGTYRNTRTNDFSTFEFAAGQLRVAGGPALRALRDGSFAAGAQRLLFTTSADGAPTGILTPTADGDSVKFVFVARDKWVPADAELAAIAGRYRNDEINVTFTVTLTSGVLSVSPRVGVSELLAPIAKDAFTTAGGSVWFTRDPRGRVAAMHFGEGRVWDFVSARVP